jgi:hypothetical protein
LGDLFLHGIGGAKYDQVTDLLMARFFKLPPPAVMVISATLHLPVARPTAVFAAPAAIAAQLRELTYHPERFLPASAGEDEEVAALLEAKRRWTDTPQTAENARARWQSIRQINEALGERLSDHRRRLIEYQGEAAQRLQAEKILAWREYGFCLHPEASLREFLAGLLPKNF